MWGAHKVCFGITRLHVNKYVPCKNSASVFLELMEQACRGKQILRQLSYTLIEQACRREINIKLVELYTLIEQARRGKQILPVELYMHSLYMPLAKSNNLFNKCRCFIPLTRGEDIISCMLPGFGDPRLRMKGAYIE